MRASAKREVIGRELACFLPSLVTGVAGVTGGVVVGAPGALRWANVRRLGDAGTNLTAGVVERGMTTHTTVQLVRHPSGDGYVTPDGRCVCATTRRLPVRRRDGGGSPTQETVYGPKLRCPHWIWSGTDRLAEAGGGTDHDGRLLPSVFRP